jgi:DNA polymerase-3 subunit delta
VTLIAGPETFLASRALARVVADLKALNPDASWTVTAAEQLDLGQLQEVTGADLFASETIATLQGIERLPKALEAPLLDLVADLPGNVALVCVHGGGNQGKRVLDRLRALARPVIDCPTLKSRQVVDFVSDEVRGLGGTIEPGAAHQLIEAIGTDTRALAAAVAQLLDDSERGSVTTPQVRRYFAGRATVTGFAVADDCVAGRTTQAMVKLRWALATGVGHPQITSALANSLRQLGKYYAAARQSSRSSDIAAAIDAPYWKIDGIAREARFWDERSVAQAIRAVAKADAAVKGAAGDPDFALEQLILAVTACRRSARAA